MKVWMGSGEAGALVDAAEARISVFDHGFTVGDGVFETMKCVMGRVFLWPWHLERLHQSADVLGIALPGDATLTTAVQAVAADWAQDESGPARIRVTVTAGLGPLGSGRMDAESTVVVAAAPVPHRPGPATLRVNPWPRSEHGPLVGVKSTSYAEHVFSLAHARAAGADEAVYRNGAGYVSEGTGSNLFIVRDGHLITPPRSAGLLAGVTRRFVLGLGDADLPIREANITLDGLHAADEVCITSSLQDVRAVSHVDHVEYREGPVVRELQRRFTEAASAADCWT